MYNQEIIQIIFGGQNEKRDDFARGKNHRK
jgi:hypothetical protein